MTLRMLLLCFNLSFFYPVFAEGKDKPVDHIVLIKVKSGTPDSVISQMIEETKKLPKSIPEIVQLSVGKNFTDRNKGFEVGIVIRFKNRNDIKTYRDHPVHVKFADTYVRPFTDEIIVLDYEI